MLLFIKNNNPIAIQITIHSSSSVSNFIPIISQFITTITYLIRFMVGPHSHLMIFTFLQSQFCFKPQYFPQIGLHQQPLLPGIWFCWIYIKLRLLKVPGPQPHEAQLNRHPRVERPHEQKAKTQLTHG